MKLQKGFPLALIKSNPTEKGHFEIQEGLIKNMKNFYMFQPIPSPKFDSTSICFLSFSLP